MSHWLVTPKPISNPRLRLVCFPHAGGGSNAFRGWADAVPAGVELVMVRLPGREHLFSEPLIDDWSRLRTAIVDQLTPLLDRPYALFGHSLGGLIAFETARELRRRGAPLPTHVFPTGFAAPHLPRKREPIAHLPTPEFIEALRERGGTPSEVLASTELMELLAPMIRADFLLVEKYQYVDELPLACPITAMGGSVDEGVPVTSLDAWERETHSGFRRVLVPGGHFFLQSACEHILEAVESALASPPELRPGLVHVWRFPLRVADSQLTRLRSLLTDDERDRAGRFRDQPLQDAFTVGRGMMRTLLSRYLDTPPGSLVFTEGPAGKPSLVGGEVQFNLAHSGDWAVLAVCPDRTVGIDVERERGDIDYDGIVKRYFTPGEVMQLRALGDAEREAKFFTCWVRKEAYLKATGQGFSLPIDQVDVLPREGGPARLRRLDDVAEGDRWSLFDLAISSGYRGALVVEGSGVGVWLGDGPINTIRRN